MNIREQFEETHPLFDLSKDNDGEYTAELTRIAYNSFVVAWGIQQENLNQLSNPSKLNIETEDNDAESEGPFVWVYEEGNRNGTEIAHLLISHAEEYSRDDLINIGSHAGILIHELRKKLREVGKK